jgi:GT2 family glycosyltransferase
VIVPTHNRPDELLQLVECLTRQDMDPSTFEVIVVDDGSRQPACQLLGPLRTAFDLQVITQSSSGPGAARNRGVELAKADMIVFFNDDAVPASDCLRRHLEVQEASDGKHAVLGTFTLLPERVVDSFTTHVETSTVLFAQPHMSSGTSYAGTSFCTGNLSVSRNLLENVGGFDESFRYAGGEDSELGLRLDRELGIRVLYDATVRCEHDHELRLRGFLKRMRVIGWAAYRIEEKHGNTGLVQGQPTDEAGWVAMRELVEQEAGILGELLEAAEDACRRERESGLGAMTLDAYKDIYDMIAGYGMRCGILAAHEGALVDLSDEVLAIAV